MKYSTSTMFLRYSVDDSYAFFWHAYESPFKLTVKDRKLGITDESGGKDEIDRRPPFLACAGTGRRYYAPLRRNPAMHREFCEISDNKGLAQFASKYGPLGFTRSYSVHRRGARQSATLLIESIARWRYELAEIQRLVYLWDMVKSNRLSLLGALISRERNGIYITLGKRRDLIDDTSSALVRKWDAEGEQPVEAALHYLTTSINRKVTGKVFPAALPTFHKKVYLMPGNLMAAMWLMFLWEVIGEVRPRKCPGCGGWFDPKRSTRSTCGDRCRKRKSRQNLKKPES